MLSEKEGVVLDLLVVGWLGDMTLKFKRCCRTFDFFSEIINGRCGLTPETAIRIALATDTSPESWLNMQTKLDLWNALREKPKNVIKFVVSKERYANRAVRLKS